MKRITIALAVVFVMATIAITTSGTAGARTPRVEGPAFSTSVDAVAAAQAVQPFYSGADNANVTTSATSVTASTSTGTVGISLPAAAAAPVANGPESVVIGKTSTSVVDPENGAVSVSQVIDTTGPSTVKYKFTLPKGYSLQPQAACPSTMDVTVTGGSATDWPITTSENSACGLIAVSDGPANAVPTQADTLGWINTPTAIDANGNAVPTSFVVKGKSTLIQTVTPTSSTAFPVVADPYLTFGWVIYVHFTHSNVGSAAYIADIAGVSAGVAWACALLSNIDGIPGALVPVCLAIGAWLGGFFTALFQTAWNRGGDLVIEITYPPSMEWNGYYYAGNGG